MGAYVGALWAKGYDPDEMEKMAMECSGLMGALKLADPKLWPVRGLLKGKLLKRDYARDSNLPNLRNSEFHWLYLVPI